MQKITPFLWFDTNAEQAVNFYLSVFKEAKRGKMLRYGDAGPGPKGQVITAEFEVFGLNFVALNGGPQFNFTEAISFSIDCKSQEEVDYYWDKLSEGGEESMCGWLKDKFGVSWQVTPTEMPQLLSDKDPAKANAAMRAMLQMKKIDIGKIKEAVAAAK